MPHALIIGSSDGIGLSLSKRLIRRGWHVTALSRRNTAIEDPQLRSVLCDVNDPDFPAKLAEIDALSAIDVCVFCVGIGEPFNGTAFEQETQTLRTNLISAALTIETILPRMLARSKGHFIGLSSLADMTYSPEAPAYAASKAAFSSYLVGLAQALRGRGVAITNLRFGFVDTKMAKSPVRPLLISPEQAVDVIERCLDTRPVQVSYPKRMAWLVALLALWNRLKLLTSR